MINKIEQSVVVRSRDGITSPGKVFIQTWIRAERLKRSLKFLGYSWLFAVLSVFLPIAHFILVPGFLLAGPIAAYFVYHQESVVLGGESLCPKCGKSFAIVRGPNKWPWEDYCSGCQAPFKIELL